jgi:hypothetical protein
MAYFLKDKKDFIKEFDNYLQTKNNLSKSTKENSLIILKILRSEIDGIEKDYKILKQKILKKARKKEIFYKIKEDLLNFRSNEPIIHKEGKELKKEKIEKITLIQPLLTSIEEIDNFKDSENVINILKEPEHSNLDKTKKILMELTDLLTHFSTKVYQHQEMAETSIIILQ